VTLEEAVLKVLETEAARDGLSNAEIYRVLAELQKKGKLKAIINYDVVKKFLENLKVKGKIREEKGLIEAWIVSGLFLVNYVSFFDLIMYNKAKSIRLRASR